MFVAAPIPQPRWSRAFVASLALHVAAIGALVVVALSHTPPPPEPAPIRVQLLRVAEVPAPAAAAAPAQPPPAPKRTVAPPKPAPPKPMVARVPKPKPTPAPKPVAATPAPTATVDVPAAETAAVSAPAPTGTGTHAAAQPSGLVTGRSVAGSVDEIDLYMASVRALIQKHKRYPPLAKRRGIEGRLTLRLAVAADGSVEAAVIESSGAGSALLEEGALAAVAAVSPLPPPPSGNLRFDLPVRFSLKE